MSEARKAFEAWAKLAFPHMSLLKKGDTDKYVYKTANFACEAFCEGEAWQASRQALEGEPVAEVAQVGGTPVVFWDKSLTVGTKLYTRTASRHALSSCSEIPNSSGHACRQAVSVPDAWCVVTNDDQIQYTAMVDKNLGLPIEQSHDYAWQQCNEVIQEWIELGLDAASKYVIRPIAFEERVAELECMVRAFRACVDLQMVPSWGSPCHDQIHALVGKNTEEGT